MQVEAIYHHGKLEFAQPIRLRQQSFKITVDIPDAELLSPEEIAPSKKDTHMATGLLRQRIDAILAPYQEQLRNTPSYTPADYKAIWYEHLEEKYLEKR